MPGDGDFALIQNGHTITITDDVTVGDGSSAITVQATGQLTQNGSTTLITKGNILVNGIWRGLPGHTHQWFNTSSLRTFSFDPPWNGSGYVHLGTDGNTTRSTWEPHPSNTQTFNFVTDTGVGHPQDWRFYSVDFSGIYNASDRVWPSITLNGGYQDRLIIEDSTWDDCGFLSLAAIDQNATVEITDNTFTNSRGATTFYAIFSEDYSTGTRSVTGNVFDTYASLYNPDEGTVVEDNIFLGGLTTVWTENEKPSSWARNIVFHDCQNILIEADITDDIWIADDGSDTNCHGPNMMGKTFSSFTVDGVVAEFVGADTTGDFILLGTGSGTLTVQNSILIKNSNNSSWGTLVTGLGDSDVNLIAYHNSGFVRDGSSTNSEFIRVGETSYLNSLLMKSNLIVSDVASASVHCARDQTGSTSVAAAVDIDYNVCYNITDAGDFSTKYSNFSGSPAYGANDVSADPGLSDIDVSLAGWDSDNGGAGTVANAKTELGKRNLATFNTDYTHAKLLEYYRAGWTPSNGALENAGHDGEDIGSQSVSSGGGAGSMLTLGAG